MEEGEGGTKCERIVALLGSIAKAENGLVGAVFELGRGRERPGVRGLAPSEVETVDVDEVVDEVVECREVGGSK